MDSKTVERLEEKIEEGIAEVIVKFMAMAGGGLWHGQVIGATEKDGGRIKERPVTPGDLAATIYRHMEVPLDATYLDPTGRPNPIVQNGKPIAELL